MMKSGLSCRSGASRRGPQGASTVFLTPLQSAHRAVSCTHSLAVRRPAARPGDLAQIIIVDLLEGTERMVAQTRGWDTQLGAQVQWGRDDTQLFFNDVDPAEWRAFGVRLDPLSGRRKDLEGTVYMLSPDGCLAASPCLLRMAATQLGYWSRGSPCTRADQLRSTQRRWDHGDGHRNGYRETSGFP